MRSPLRAFLEHEATGGYVLMAAAAAGLIVANSPLADSYFAVLQTRLGFATVLHWINDGLMAVFFLLVGLEIKRELVDGELSPPTRAALPAVAALGGVLLPAAIYLAFNSGHPESRAGWAIPTATDIAFALGVLRLAGPRVPASLKVFLTAIAILDDLSAILIIAVFYTAQLHWTALAGAFAILTGLFLLNRFRVLALWPYLIGGLALWVCVHESGVHATLAGVALALAIPVRKVGRSPLHLLEHRLNRPVALLITPLFGFANAGLPLGGLTLASLTAPVPLGVSLGLALGKPIGVFTATWAAIRLKLTAPPEGAGTAQLFGVCLLCGVGFTMSLFIGNLAFDDPALIAETKIGVLAGSSVSALAGLLVLRLARPPAR